MVNNPPRRQVCFINQYIHSAKILKIVTWPDPLLSTPCEDVINSELDDIHELVACMLKTVRSHDAIGLAAPQVGILKNIIVVDIPQNIVEYDETTSGNTIDTPLDEGFVLINPTIVKSSDLLYQWDEGCLSVPGYFEQRKRPYSITVECMSELGELCTVEFQGLHAFVVQHEIDHLSGVVFVDGMSRVKSERLRKKMKKTLKRRM
jgi:peptide deformylase